MRAARIVYTFIALFILAPWLASHARMIAEWIKGKKRPSAVRAAVFAVVTAAIISGTYLLYIYTINNQAPLVAERAGMLFTQRVEGGIDLPQYAEEMYDMGISVRELATVSGEDMKAAGFQRKHYSLSISERSFPQEDGSVIIYFKHSDELGSLYSYVRMVKEPSGWKVTEQNIFSQEQMDQLGTSLRFYNVSS